MRYHAINPESYIIQVPEARRDALQNLRNVITQNLPEGFEEGIQYGMIAYYVPFSIYPHGYHCTPNEPLPFMNIASQKHSINIYHSGIYAISDIYDWFVNEYAKYSNKKLDMGKSCIRFKKIEDIPYTLIGELCTKITVDEWIKIYEARVKTRKKR